MAFFPGRLAIERERDRERMRERGMKNVSGEAVARLHCRAFMPYANSSVDHHLALLPIEQTSSCINLLSAVLSCLNVDRQRHSVTNLNGNNHNTRTAVLASIVSVSMVNRIPHTDYIVIITRFKDHATMKGTFTRLVLHSFIPVTLG